MLLANRVLILGANAGRLRGELLIDLTRPHDRGNPRFKALVDYVYTVMTHPDANVMTEPTEGAVLGVATQTRRSPHAQPLPHARVGGISGLLELIIEQPEGRDDIPRLAERLQLRADDLLPILDAAVLLGFAAVTQGDVMVTPSGRGFAEADILTSKDLFRQAVLAHAPLVASMYRTLREERDGTMGVDFFLTSVQVTLFPRAQTTVWALKPRPGNINVNLTELT